MNKAEEIHYKAVIAADNQEPPKDYAISAHADHFNGFVEGFIKGYHQAEKDIKEELSNLFQEFMLDCIKDDTETHILHFVDVFNNKIKTIGNG